MVGLIIAVVASLEGEKDSTLEVDKILHFYVVKSGAVEVSREEGDEEINLGTVEAGDVVGVVSVLRGERRLVTASAVGETYLYRMNLDRLVDSAGGADQPASIVLRSLADTVKDLAEDVLQNRRSAKA